MASPTATFSKSVKQWVSNAFGLSWIFQIEIYSEDNIFDSCHNGIHVSNVMLMESDKIPMKI